ncbi:MAG: 23S rRNA (pseudouridine(1915)-N(3))-methyltransferase RlmH [Christensenellaceae bacterium]|jgi:23S rRNA (pseudouridine1915-N3)-methyltransferase|nr:23S rRNA (pseudouridine(1915)-N(3))-methyltransferase RlmH [Christensenellaceae bacterium]
MRFSLLCVGRLKEGFWQEACAEYQKRLSRYGGVEIIELKDEPEPASPALYERALEIEGTRMLSRLRPEEYAIALAVSGRSFTSEGFAAHMETLLARGKRPAFLIGGSLGLSRAVYERADEQISFSALTFPHQLMRVILLEQLYRACRIGAGEPYHK